MVIDDDESVVRSIKAILINEGYEIFAATNGKEGLDLLKKEEPALIILDLHMPVMNGIEFLNSIKPKSSDPYTVIVLTGQVDDVKVEECFNLGVCYFITKPFDILVLRGVIKKAIELKEAEFKLKEYSENLKMLVDDRTRELTEEKEKLKKANDDLKRSQVMIFQQEKLAGLGQLAAGVAHEINNPTGFILSNLNTFNKYIERIIEFIAVQTSATEPVKVDNVNEKRNELKIDYILDDVTKLIGESLDGGNRIKKIVQDLKVFARQDDSEKDNTNINECIESTLNIVWNELKYKATVKKELTDIPLIKCYRQQLNQVFMNILINASQAIEEHGDIIIKTWHEKESVFISISDTGCGIPEKNISRLFEPFFTTKDVGQGTGLGMSISYDIIKKHNGNIFVESEEGKGTNFTIKIPVV